MQRYLVPFIIVFGAACDDGDSNDTSGDDDDSPPVETGDGYADVMRDCPAVVGNICPWAGAGINGKHPLGDAVNRLDAWFSFPMSVAFDHNAGGRPAVFDWNNHQIRAVNATEDEGFETIMGTPYLGDGDPGGLDKTEAGADGTTVALNHPTMGQYYADGVLLADTWHTHKIRTWDPATKKVHVVLGSRPGFVAGADFDQDASTVLMNQPKEIFIDPNDENLVYVLDMRNERIRLWDATAGLVNTIAGNGNKGAPGTSTGCEDPDDPLTPCIVCPADPQPALGSCFNFPKNGNPEPGGAIAVTSDSSTVYIADSEAHIIRMLDVATGMVSTISGTAGVHGYDDGPAATATWYYPTDFALDEDTNELFVADANNHAIRKIDLTTMTVSTVVGTGSPTCDILDLLIPAKCDNQQDAGDGGPATEATVYRPFGVDIDADGNLIVTDTYDHRFRIVYRY